MNPIHRSLRLPKLKTWQLRVGVAVIYGLLALFAYYPVLPGEPSRIAASASGDLTLNAWYSQWYAYAVAHAHNPFFSAWVNYPAGANVVGNTSTPILNLAAIPFTLLLNGIATFNVLMWLAFPLSAYAAFYVFHRWTKSTVGSFLGGLLYGFSPYLVGQGLGHLVLVFVPMPPLIFYTLSQMISRARDTNRVPLKYSVSFAICCAVQFLISAEVLVTTLIISLIGLLIVSIFWRQEVPKLIGPIAVSFGIVAVIFGLIVAYPAWFILYGPEHFGNLAQPVNVPYRSDLLSAVTPTYNQLFGPEHLKTIGSSFVGGDGSENAGYLSIPGILLIIALTARFWRNLWVRFSTLMIAIAYLLSLGAQLSINNHSVRFYLPYWLLNKVRFVNSLLPSRFALEMFFFFGLLIAFSAFEFRTSSSLRSRSKRWLSKVGNSSTILLGVATLIFLIPAWPYPLAPTNLPTYFTSTDVRQIPEGSVALSYPYPGPFGDQEMLWQAAAHFRFKLLGAYMYFPNNPSLETATLSPGDVEAFLQSVYLKASGIDYPAFPTLPPAAYAHPSVKDLRRFVHGNGINVLMIDRTAVGASTIFDYFARGYGTPTYEGPLLAVWVIPRG